MISELFNPTEDSFVRIDFKTLTRGFEGTPETLDCYLTEAQINGALEFFWMRYDAEDKSLVFLKNLNIKSCCAFIHEACNYVEDPYLESVSKKAQAYAIKYLIDMAWDYDKNKTTSCAMENLDYGGRFVIEILKAIEKSI